MSNFRITQLQLDLIYIMKSQIIDVIVKIYVSKTKTVSLLTKINFTKLMRILSCTWKISLLWLNT